MSNEVYYYYFRKLLVKWLFANVSKWNGVIEARDDKWWWLFLVYWELKEIQSSRITLAISNNFTHLLRSLSNWK